MPAPRKVAEQADIEVLVAERATAWRSYAMKLARDVQREALLTDDADQYIAVHYDGTWYEADRLQRDRKQFILDIVSGQYEGIAKVLKVNIGDGTCSDASEDIAADVFTEAEAKYRAEPIPSHLHDFLASHTAFDRLAEDDRAERERVA